MSKARKRLRWVYCLLFLLLVTLVFLQFSDWFSRLVYPFHYRKLINLYADEYNLDPYLVAAIIFVESHFDSRAVSVKGAIGLMQIMPATGSWAARQMGLDLQEGDLFEPEINIQVGCWYLGDLFQEFDNNPYLVLAAYNGGKGNVRRWLEEGIWEGDKKGLENIPFLETRRYVSDVAAVSRKYRELYD
ncbi:MAG: lytic transglycosylase domain-containing protein [Halanaerobium sp.]|nr:lytic transglycosylase domain-containing protein [Halanaerobium sp.]